MSKQKGSPVNARLGLSLRLSACLTSLTLSILLTAAAIGLIPDRESAIVAGRKALSEAIAIQCSVAAQRNDLPAAKQALAALVERHLDLLSVAVRGPRGDLLLSAASPVGSAQASAEPEQPAEASVEAVLTPTLIRVPITRGDTPWGTLEIRFQPLPAPGPLGIFNQPLYRLLGFIAAGGFFVYFLYLWRLLGRRQLQSTAVPQRIRDTLDTLVEGVLILDKDQRIALANEAFADNVDSSPNNLAGRKVSELSWTKPALPGEDPELPWDRALEEGKAQKGVLLGLSGRTARPRAFSVNATPICGQDGSPRGTLATFDDLTTAERKNAQLRKLLLKLKLSRAEIRKQNLELRALATTDPLTSCLNRRAFFQEFEVRCKEAQRHDFPLICIMVDIDHFKLINDRHGHRVGDLVLEKVAEILRGTLRQTDLLCRYGGEEFCILLPHIDIDGAERAGQRVRQAIEQTPCLDIALTASLGVASLQNEARSPQELLDQADRALYAAKRAGRNRVIRWHPELDDGQSGPFTPEPAAGPDYEGHIPFHAVTALVSALGHRNLDTGAHSRRVADLCVATANRLMSQSQCYLLEVAALLHDIGKLAVPDCILLKPGPLTPEEWKVMRTHERAGEDIITAAFTSPQLSAIVRSHHCWYGGSPHDADLPTGKDIPLGARILAIADAYDAITSDRVYRKKRTREEAFVELRRCAGKQFDPELVERFIEAVLARDETRGGPALAVAKQTALRIGLQMEKLAAAVDAQDQRTLAAMAGYLRANAREHAIEPLARAAAQLEQAAQADRPWPELLQLTIKVLEQCRSTYASYLPGGAADPKPTQKPAEVSA
jgi:diguanylate cyclase (GGDEF)-like protein